MATSLYEDVVVPEGDLTSFVLGRTDLDASAIAVRDVTSGVELSYGQLVSAVEALASGLQQRGLERGAVVALLLSNGPHFPVVFHGVLSAGGVVTTINPIYTETEIAHQLRDSGAALVFTIQEHHEKVLAAASADGVALNIADVIVVDEAGGLARASSDAPLRPVAIRGEDLAALPYSSGTTGLPKGVMLTHANLIANLLQTGATEQIDEGDVVLAVLPLFHIYGMTVTMNYCLWAGATVVTLARYDRVSFPQVLADQRITRLYVAPPLVLDLVQRSDLESYDLTALAGVLCGAAPLDEATARAAAERLGVPVVKGYGMTELSPCSHLTSIFDSRAPIGTIGKALPSTECRVVDLVSGEEVPAGERGELLIRGPQVMAGYLGNPSATASTIDADGFLHTGDIAVVDDEGYFFIVDRLKELIKFNGYQIAPAELEAVLLSHPSVADAAVIGLPDPSSGEIPKAFVVVKDETAGDDLMHWVAGRVAPYKKVRRIEIVESIPKSASGKILRRELREREDAGPLF